MDMEDVAVAECIVQCSALSAAWYASDSGSYGGDAVSTMRVAGDVSEVWSTLSASSMASSKSLSEIYSASSGEALYSSIVDSEE